MIKYHDTPKGAKIAELEPESDMIISQIKTLTFQRDKPI